MWGGKEPALAGDRDWGRVSSDEQVLLLMLLLMLLLLLTVLYCNYSTQMVRARQGWAGLGMAGGAQSRVGKARRGEVKCTSIHTEGQTGKASPVMAVVTSRREGPSNKTRPGQSSSVRNRAGAPYGNPMGRTASEDGSRVDDRETGCRTRTVGHDGGTHYAACRTCPYLDDLVTHMAHERECACGSEGERGQQRESLI